MLPYFYTIMSLTLCIIWVALYFFLPQCRRSMFWTSWPFASGGPLFEYWHRSDYWHPPYLIDFVIGNWHFGIEDYVTAFSVIGISTAIFEILALRKGLASIPSINAKTYFRIKFWGIACIGLILIAIFAGLNSIVALFIAFATLTILMQHRHWNIFSLAFISAVIFTVFYWLYYFIFFELFFPSAISTYWKLGNTWGIMITGIPIEEFIWAFLTCLFLAPVYRLCATIPIFGKY